MIFPGPPLRFEVTTRNQAGELADCYGLKALIKTPASGAVQIVNYPAPAWERTSAGTCIISVARPLPGAYVLGIEVPSGVAGALPHYDEIKWTVSPRST